jgi:dTDP-4-dehydrorhamnose reductase
MEAAFSTALEQADPDCVVNLIAATNVDQCQRDMGHAALLNCFVPQLLSRLCGDGVHLIHISSDQVYGGRGPHDELSTRPVNVYALTKLIGEYPVLQSGGCVLRTNFFGRSRTPVRSSLSDWLVAAGRKGEHVRVFHDVWFSPLGMTSLSSAIVRAAHVRLAGLFNVGAATAANKAEFARMLFDRLGLDVRLLTPVSIESAGLDAPRPQDMRMDSNRFAKATGFAFPTIQQEIDHEAGEYLRP